MAACCVNAPREAHWQPQLTTSNYSRVRDAQGCKVSALASIEIWVLMWSSKFDPVADRCVELHI
ncbi:hypothetical protein TRIUR3_12593 [Triticum urartu]|uniref:Uncharacterized protein n=1 Tax=Triticum urartu TaxID=4572 RepID=M7ZGB3_TRIUA|nr:hypothetical protein TRIUR3_12593 [Triticum urartu]